MTEKEKMLAGLPYSAVDEQLLRELNECKDVVHRYNELLPSKRAERTAMLKSLLGHVGDDNILINQPFYCDYGKHISVGKRFFANFNFTVLDEALVTIGDDCFIGPNVGIYTACHSTDPVERNTRREWALPVTIGDNVWIGGSGDYPGGRDHRGQCDHRGRLGRHARHPQQRRCRGQSVPSHQEAIGRNKGRYGPCGP